MKLKIGIIMGIVLLIVLLFVVVLRPNKSDDLSNVDLKITCDGNDLSGKYKEGDSFECNIVGETYVITVKSISNDIVKLKCDKDGLYPERDEGTISLLDKIRDFELTKGKKLVLRPQVTDVSSSIEIYWK